MGKSKPTYEGIIVLGAPRSGTTLLRRLLDAHPDFACPGETNLFTACGRFLKKEPIAEGVDIGVLNGLSYAGFSDAQVLDRLRAFAFEFLREHARNENKPRWVEKTAFNSFYVDEIEKLCGDDVHFICILRHGLDVACSIQELCDVNGGYLAELHEYIKRYPRPLEAFAHAWVDLIESIRSFADRHPDNAVVLRYEDLITDADATMDRVLGSVGSLWDPDLVETALNQPAGIGLGDWKTYQKTQLERTSIGRWNGLSRAVVSDLGRIVNPTLVACGYEAVEVEPERDDEEARRRYELGIMLQGMRGSDEET